MYVYRSIYVLLLTKWQADSWHMPHLKYRRGSCGLFSGYSIENIESSKTGNLTQMWNIVIKHFYSGLAGSSIYICIFIGV